VHENCVGGNRESSPYERKRDTSHTFYGKALDDRSKNLILGDKFADEVISV